MVLNQADRCQRLHLYLSVHEAFRRNNEGKQSDSQSTKPYNDMWKKSKTTKARVYEVMSLWYMGYLCMNIVGFHIELFHWY
jgi:hypothetical protein